MKFHKSVMDRLVFADFDYLAKANAYRDITQWKKDLQAHSHPKKRITQFHDPDQPELGGATIAERKNRGFLKPPGATSTDFDPEKGEIEEKKMPNIAEPGNYSSKRYGIDKIKRSLFAELDELLEKARPRASERKDPNRRKAEAADDNLIIPDTKHVQTMSNPGPTEAEHYERTRSGSIENLKRLAESKHPMDRKAAAAGMKKHE